MARTATKKRALRREQARPATAQQNAFAESMHCSPASVADAMGCGTPDALGL